MKLEIKPEWCIAAARREGDAEVSAGRLDFRLEPKTEAMPAQSEAMQLAFGKLVNFMRRQRNWSIEELAKRAKVDAAELLLVEKEIHHRAEPHTVVQLANVFNLSLGVLQQLAGLTALRNYAVVDEAVRFAADSIEKLSPEQARSVEGFVSALNRLADGEKV